MEYLPFPARLCAEYNSTCEFGTASISQDGQAIDFSAEFVPLLPLGECASIEWVLAQRSLAKCEGLCYLSSAGFLRLTGVAPVLLAQLRHIFACNIRLSASVAFGEQGPPMSAAKEHAQVLYLSPSRFTLRVRGSVGEGETVLLSAEVDFLTLVKLPLRVLKQVQLSRGDILLLCQVLPTGQDNQVALAAYSARLEQVT